MTIGFVIRNSEGLYWSHKNNIGRFMKFNKNFVVIYNNEVDALDKIEDFLLNDLYIIERAISTL